MLWLWLLSLPFRAFLLGRTQSLRMRGWDSPSSVMCRVSQGTFSSPPVQVRVCMCGGSIMYVLSGVLYYSPAVTGVHSPTTPLATPPSPSLKGFSVKELYTASHSLPSPTHAHPSRHDYTKIPSHLVAHTTHSQLAKQTSTHQEENLHTSLPLHLQRMSPSREMGAGEEREEEEEGKGNKSMDGLLTMSRTGSEGFITPESSPRNSRAGTPIVMPPLPIATSAEEDPPQPPARVYETMFSKRPHKFDDFELDNDGHIPTEPFLLACRAILPFFGQRPTSHSSVHPCMPTHMPFAVTGHPSVSPDAISPVTLAPVKVGVNGDITTLYDIHKSNPLQFPTLQSMVLHELRTGTNQTPPPATNAVQWVKRWVVWCVFRVCMQEWPLCPLHFYAGCWNSFMPS